MSKVPDELRPARKLLRAVADLHTRGYQRLRIIPYYYEGIGSWHCDISPAQWVSSSHGAQLDKSAPRDELAKYTNASRREYWGWEDKSHFSPSELAGVFLERFPRLSALGYGQDWLYAGWFQYMLHVTFPDALPIANSPYDSYPCRVSTTLRRVSRMDT